MSASDRGSSELIGRREGSYIVPSYPSVQAGPRADWIGYRASIARVHKREQAGDEAVTCASCGTEVDVTEIVHSPKCACVASASGAPEGLDLLEQMDRGERIARPATSEGGAMPEIVCKVDGCDGDASDAPKAGWATRLCATHRAERSAQIQAGKKQRAARPKRTSSRGSQNGANANGSHASKAERLCAAALAVDEIEAQLAQARAELKEAAAALA